MDNNKNSITINANGIVHQLYKYNSNNNITYFYIQV